MKFFTRLAWQGLVASVVLVSPLLLLTICAQHTTKVTSTRSNSPQSFQDSSSSDSADARRLKREQAYVNLLSSQRVVVKLRNGEVSAVESTAFIKQARAVLEAATELDPTLAEAHTVLAEIALFYPPRNMDEAVRHATAATKIDHNNFGAHQVLSRVHSLRSGLSDQELNKTNALLAITELQEVARLAPNDAEGWALAGELYFALGRIDEAINAMTRWAAAPAAVDSRFFEAITGGRQLTPDSAASRLGEVLLRASRPREAITAIRRALSLNPQNSSYEELLGKAIESSGLDDTAIIEELQNMAAANPEGTTAPILLARVLARAGRIEDAVKTLRTAIGHAEANKGGLSLRLALGQTLADAERNSEAIGVYEEILKQKGIAGDTALVDQSEKQVVAGLLRRIIAIQKNSGQLKEALATIARMRLLLGSSDPTIDIGEVDLLRAFGQRREALKALQAAQRRYPDEREFVYLEATVLMELGNVEEGVSLHRARLSQQSKSASASSSALPDIELYLRISNLYTQAGRGTEAVAAAREAVGLASAGHPEVVPAALITLSSAQERAGDTKGSEESLRRVLAGDPENATALNNLGYFLVERNERLSEALEMIRRAVKAEPTNPSFLDSLGWVQFKLGQHEEAERNLIEAARRSNTSATIQEHLGDVYFGRGKKELARLSWEKALKLVTIGDQASRVKMKLNRNPK